MTKQSAEINGSGAKIRSIAEFLINGANDSFIQFEGEKNNSLMPLLIESEGAKVKHAQ